MKKHNWCYYRFWITWKKIVIVIKLCSSRFTNSIKQPLFCNKHANIICCTSSSQLNCHLTLMAHMLKMKIIINKNTLKSLIDYNNYIMLYMNMYIYIHLLHIHWNEIIVQVCYSEQVIYWQCGLIFYDAVIRASINWNVYDLRMFFQPAQEPT